MTGNHFRNALNHVVAEPNIERGDVKASTHSALTGFQGQQRTSSPAIATLAQVRHKHVTMTRIINKYVYEFAFLLVVVLFFLEFSHIRYNELDARFSK